MGVTAMKKHLILSAGLLAILFLLLFCEASGAALAEDGKPTISAAEWQAKGYTVVYLEDKFGADETGGKLADGYFVLRKDINYLTEKPGSENAVNGNSFTRSGFQTVQTGKDSNANMYCIQSGDRFYFGHVDTEENGDTIVLKDMVSINNGQYSPNVTPYTVGAWIDWRVDFRAEIPGVPFFGDGYFQILLDHHSVDPGAWAPTEHTIEYYNGIHFERIGVKAEDETTEDYDVGLFSIKHAVGMARLELSLIEFWGELSFDADALMGVEVLCKSYGPVFWDWSAIPHPKNGITINKVSRANSHGGLELSINVGPKVSAEWMLIQDLELDLSLLGVYMTGSNYGHGYSLIGDGEYKWHVCANCFQEKLTSVIGPLKCILDLVGLDPINLINIDPEDLEQFYQFYYSVDHEECGEGDCPYWAYPTHVHVTNQRDSKPLSGVEVSFRPHPWDCYPYEKGTTGSDGKVDLYMKPGEDYYVTAELDHDPDWVISKERMMHKGETADTFDIALDIPVKTVYFKNPESGEASDWPDDIDFMPFYSEDVQLPDKIPSLSGRQFVGWNTAEDGSGTAYAPGTTLTLTEDLTLWAQWQLAGDSWYVIYNANGGTKVPVSQVIPKGQDAVLTEELPESGDLIFKGWTTDLKTAAAEYLPGDTLPYDSEKNVVVLYALWKLDPAERPWVLSFRDSLTDEASGIPNPMSVDPSVSADVIIPSQIPEKSGRIFAGWNTVRDGSGKDYAPGSRITLTGDTVLWAQWEKAENTWVIVYDANGGKDAPSPSVIQSDYTAIISVKKPVHGSMKFLGWALSPDAAKAEYQPLDLLHNTEGKPVIVLYAVWELSPGPRPIHISFDANGLQDAGLPADIWQDPAWVRLEPAVAPLGSEYMFRGWSEYSGTKDPEYQVGHPYYFDRDTVLYAIWDKQDTVTLTFRDSLADSVSGIPDPITIVPSMSKYVRIPSQIPQKSGRAFTGWNTARDGNGTKYTPGSTITLVKDATLWAQWDIAGNSWYILYDANGGTKAPDTQIVQQGQNAVLTKELPENGSLVFKGWATDPEAAAAEYQPGDTLKYNSGKTYVVLYALWELDPAARPVTVSFDVNGGLPGTAPNKITVSKGEWVQLPAQQPSWDAQHDFRGWSADSRATVPTWKAGDAVLFEQDTTLYAVWYAHYKVIEGAGSVWTKGSGKPQRFVADGNRKYFTELRVDGLPFNEGVEISSGSTVAYINAKAMEKLSVGEHTVTFVYVDGEASAPFTVQKKLPPTGDTGHPVLWLTLIILGITGLILPGMLLRKAGRKK